MREARAYNQSVLFMLAMPYLLLTGVGLLIYREVRSARRKQALDPSASGSLASEPSSLNQP